MTISNLFLVYCDGVEYSQLGFQDVGSSFAEQIVFFHDNVMFVVLLILIIVGWIMVVSMLNRHYYKYLIEGTIIEIVWTLIPALVLIFIALPSLQLLYCIDEVIDPSLTVKVVGHQWYWSYEYSDIDGDGIEFDSYMVPTSDLNSGDLSLLEVDNSIVVPVDNQVSVIVSATDVIHCFALPSLGINTDAVPGRLNQVSFLVKSPGVFYGQCSEICGSDHSFMPIVLEAVSQEKFFSWVKSHLDLDE